MKAKTFRIHAWLSLIVGFLVFHSNLNLPRLSAAPMGAIVSGAYIQDWKEFSSSVGGFSILFPKVPNESSNTLNVGKMIVNTHTYSVQDDNTYSVLYFDVPHKNDPKARGDLLLGFRNFVLAEFKAELVSDNPVTIANYAGRLLELSVPKRGTARALILVTEARLYRIAVVPEKLRIPEEVTKAASTRFLESFKLSAIDSSGEGAVDAYLRSHPELAQRAISTGNSDNILNGKAILLIPPAYPLIARGVRASGTVMVKVIIDEEGKVIAAQAIIGHPLLRSTAEAAARKARFTPTLEEGVAVKVLGRVQYNFVLQ